MICSGDLVQDWRGRAGIAVDTTGAPATDSVGQELASKLGDLPERTTWWSVALFSGAVVSSPMHLTYSWGKAGQEILRMASRCCEPGVRNRLAELIESEESGKGPECIQ